MVYTKEQWNKDIMDLKKKSDNKEIPQSEYLEKQIGLFEKLLDEVTLNPIEKTFIITSIATLKDLKSKYDMAVKGASKLNQYKEKFKDKFRK